MLKTLILVEWSHELNAVIDIINEIFQLQIAQVIVSQISQ